MSPEGARVYVIPELKRQNLHHWRTIILSPGLLLMLWQENYDLCHLYESVVNLRDIHCILVQMSALRDHSENITGGGAFLFLSLKSAQDKQNLGAPPPLSQDSQNLGAPSKNW